MPTGGAGGDKSDWIRNLARRAGVIAGTPGEGATIDASTGEPVARGFAVALPGHESMTPADEFTGDTIRQYMDQHATEVEAEGHLGIWHDPESHQVWVEPTTVVHEDREAEAIQLGGDRNQISIFDLTHGREIPTGGTGGSP